MSEIQAGPLQAADPEGDHHPGPLPRSRQLGRASDLWKAWRRRQLESREARTNTLDDHQAGPLPQAAPDDEIKAGPLDQHEGPINAPSRLQHRQKKTWREKRWERRRRRRFTEEVMGWVLVPVILVSCYWAVRVGLNALGTDFTSLVQGIKTVLSAAGKA